MKSQAGLVNRRQRNEGRLDHAARLADRVKFGKEFGCRYTVFVDTEEEFDWSQPRSRSSTSTSAMRHLPEFQTLMDAHGVVPTYLVDYPIVDNPASIDVLQTMISGGNCRIGTQLHPWVNPPFEEEIVTHNSFAGNLPIELERAKLLALTDKIEAAVNVRPTVYRAGRYGVGPNTSRLLVEAGYKVDTSVRPLFDYSAEGGPNFLRHIARPYWAGPDASLLELPLSVTYTGTLRRYGRWLSSDRTKNIRRIGGMSRSGMLSRVALTPEAMPIDDVKRGIEAMIRDGHQFLSFSFHSPSLAPGHTPYVRTSADLTNFYGWWDKLFGFLATINIDPTSVDEVIDAAWSGRPFTA